MDKLESPTGNVDLGDRDPHKLTVIVFGCLFGGGPIFPSVNQEVLVDYAPDNSYKESYTDMITISMLCAGGPRKDSCQVRKDKTS